MASIALGGIQFAIWSAETQLKTKQLERLPRITPAQLMRALHRDGWFVGREGKHTILEHATKDGILLIPRHRQTLKPGTLTNILHSAGLSTDDLRRLL